MPVAVSSLSGKRVLASAIERTHPCQCPACREPLIYKRGRIVTCYFARQSRTGCALSEGESPRLYVDKTP
jgi:competence CoiA-like predicted nuclease